MGLSADGLSNTVIRVLRVISGSKNLPINRDGVGFFPRPAAKRLITIGCRLRYFNR
jgi:2'-5' RNA ligase